MPRMPPSVSGDHFRPELRRGPGFALIFTRRAGAQTLYRFLTISFMISTPRACNGPMPLPLVNHMPFCLAGQ